MATKPSKDFSAKQKEIVARKMGYDGPMSMFDVFLNASPTESRRYEMLRDKFMAKGGGVKMQEGGVVDPNAPQKPAASQVTAAQMQEKPAEFISTQLAPTAATTATAVTPTTAVTAAAPTISTAPSYTAATAAPAVQQVTATTQAAQGQVAPEAQVQAAQATPTETAIAGLTAAQGVARQVEGAPVRTVQSGELIEGPAVNRKDVEDAIAKAEAAQGMVSEKMTVQGQLAQLTADFQAGDPPAWAAGSLRNATAALAQRGLGASSLAGQALIQATLEAAIPIATADAQVYQQMELQNLSNRQQVALLAAQQRAQFLGQEFDQTFQTRVVNASRIADIANVNFSAQQQIALENARMAQTVDLTNLSNRQALVMANAAQIATLETANLNNRQQAAVVNAQSFLQMDMANLANEQQIEMFNAQANIQSLLTDQAAINASRQFNATSQAQTDQFFAGLTAQVNQFNSTQTNAMAQFNTDQANTIAKFNAEVQNQRDVFNAQNRLVIDQSNAVWRREISTANTAAINRANEFNATKAMELTTIEYNNMWQRYRDNIEYAWKTSENNAERVNKIVTTEIGANASVMVATINKDAKVAETIGNSAATILKGSVDMGSVVSGAWGWVSSAASKAEGWFGNLFGDEDEGIQWPE